MPVTTQYELQLSDLESMEPRQVISTGVMPDTPLGIHMTGSGRELRWVAVRGRVPDWAVYCHWAERSIEWILGQGDKVPKEYARRLVPCSDEVLARYRL